MSNEPQKVPPFSREMDFRYGTLETVAPGVRRIVCHNPSPFTFKGTNLYVLGEGRVAVVDPGPATDDQLDVLMEALGSETVSHILLTHCHADHSGAVAALKARTGAPTCGMPREGAPLDDEASGPSGRAFVVSVPFDVALQDGADLTGPSWRVQALHTPGHAPDHLCFFLPRQNILLSGDHVMGWNTSVIAPPEGNMGRYMRSLELLLDRTEETYLPAHGGPITEPQRFVRALIIHRRWRESEIAGCMRDGLTKIADMVPRIYPTIEPRLAGAAAAAVLAQIEYMIEKGMAAERDGLGGREYILTK